ncbi:MAG: hypothetical protein IT366_24450 [Candidatus Hydrogenedentes bacterium]|nr:hypothetical protein [Candidatus Hydrogenedentota bacterium]
MITRHNCGYDVECDTCGRIEDYDTDDFDEVLDTIKSIGWRIIKDDDEYKHYCEDCHDHQTEMF